MTDHKAEAESVLTYHLRRTLTDPADVIALGQLNATLYLAEQQRVANPIAVRGVRASNAEAAQRGAEVYDDEGNLLPFDELRERIHEISREIHASLGLT